MTHLPISLPTDWAEIIEKKYFLKVASVLNEPAADDTEARMALVKLFNPHINFAELAEGSSMGIIPAIELLDKVLPALDFIWDTTPEQNPLPDFLHDGVTYIGLEPYFANQTGAQFEQSGWAFAEYIKTKNPERITDLIAALYTPAGVAFSKEILEQNKADLANLPDPLKYGVLLYYTLVENWYAERFNFLFDGPTTEEIDSHSNSRLIRSLAGTTRGTVNEVRLMPRDEIFFELAELERIREAQKK